MRCTASPAAVRRDQKAGRRDHAGWERPAESGTTNLSSSQAYGLQTRIRRMPPGHVGQGSSNTSRLRGTIAPRAGTIMATGWAATNGSWSGAVGIPLQIAWLRGEEPLLSVHDHYACRTGPPLPILLSRCWCRSLRHRLEPRGRHAREVRRGLVPRLGVGRPFTLRPPDRTGPANAGAAGGHRQDCRVHQRLAAQRGACPSRVLVQPVLPGQ